MRLAQLFDLDSSANVGSTPEIFESTTYADVANYHSLVDSQLTLCRNQLGVAHNKTRALQAIQAILESHKDFGHDPEIAANSIWLYTRDCGGALHIMLNEKTAEITWLGSVAGVGKQLLETGLALSRDRGARIAQVTPIWESREFYLKLGFAPVPNTRHFEKSLVMESQETLDRDELETLLSAIEYEQEEIDSASYDAEDEKYQKLEKDFKALEAVSYVVKNNLRAMDNPELGKSSLFLYDYTPDVGVFSVGAAHVVIEDSVAHVKWLGSYGKKPGAGKRLLLRALSEAKKLGATKSVVEAKWESEGFYHKLGYDVEKQGEFNPFSGSRLTKMSRNLEEAWTEEDQRMVHRNPSVQDLKRLARNARYHSARFVIYKDGSLVAADSEHYTHHSMAPAMGAWVVRGYVQYMGDNDYAYRSMELYSPKSLDHPLFRKWEASGIENGNPAVVEGKWSKKYKKSIDCNNPRGFSQRAHCAGRRKRRAGVQTSSTSVSEASLNQVQESDEAQVDEIQMIPHQSFGQAHILQILHLATQQTETIDGLELYVFDENSTRLVAAWDDQNKQLAAYVVFQHLPQLRSNLYVAKNTETLQQYRGKAIAGRLYKYCKTVLNMTIQSDVFQSISGKMLWTKTLPALGLKPQVLDLQTNRTLDTGQIDPYENNNKRYCWILEACDHYPNQLAENSLIQPYKGIYAGLLELARVNKSLTECKKYLINTKQVTTNYITQQSVGYPDVVSEAFKQPYKMPNRWTGDPAVKHITLPDGQILRIEIGWDPENRYALVNFFVNDQQQITHKGDQFKIFSTVIHAIDDFVRKKKPSFIAWTASDSEPSRIKFYDRLVPWMQTNKILADYENLTDADQELIPDDFIEFIDEYQGPVGRTYVLGRKSWLRQHTLFEFQHSQIAVSEDLRKWFRQKWVRFGPDGKIRGSCARGSEGEGKPKCLPQKKAWALGKKKRATAARRKRREDPNPERKGAARNVATKESQEQACPHCGGALYPADALIEKKDACYYKVKSRYKVWPSAYASGALVQCRKRGAKNWGKGKKK
jgi:hypothetical protein